MQPRLSLRNITKRYPGIVANDGISLDIMPGEVLAVLGENGAGKSTLMKIIYGSVRQDEGTVEFDGRPLEISSPAEARALGIAMVHQHFALFDTLTVAENISLGLTKHRPLPEIASEVERLGRKYGLEVDPSAVVYALSMGERQRVEIIRALMTSPKLLILDEPTSVLVPQAVHKLFATLHRLASEGVSILFISHKLDEIRELADRCVVLRAGRIITTVNPKKESEESLARLMIGAEPPKLQAPSGEPGETIFEFRDVTVPTTLRACGLNNVSLSVRKGEIVGIAGISGNGQARLMSVGSGEMLVNPDAVRLFGESVGACGTKARRMRGLRYVPEQRLGHAAVPEISLQTNTYLTGDSFVRRGFILKGKARRFTDTVIERFHVKTPSSQSPAGSLSGGNLQKFIMGREILQRPHVLLVHQPTWGVDVGAAASIHNALMRLRADGAAVLVVSEEIEELFAICDRIAVMYRGYLSPAVPKAEMNVEIIGRWMSGLWPGGPAEKGRTAA
jgi:simple sugar transport system ATP-binding protein